jgi:3-oxoacyl-[acyl-carrier-protein] synthase-3
MFTTPVSLAGYGLYLPEGVETAAEIAARSGLTEAEVTGGLGVRQKPRPAPEDQPGVMAQQAARTAALAAGIDPEKLDVVIWVGEEYKDYVCQTAGIRLQEEMGARKAWAFDLVGQGTTLLSGLRVAADLMAGDAAVNLVLLAGGSRTVDLVDYGNPDTRWLLPTAAGAGALVLKRGQDCNRLLGWRMVVDPEMADECFVMGGGTLHPFSPDNLGTAEMFFGTPRPEVMRAYLSENFSLRLGDAIAGALEDAGLDRPDFLALPHLTPAQRRTVLARFGLETGRSSDSTEWGHVGPFDPLLGLDLARQDGRLKAGDRVVLAAAGIGFTFAAAVFDWTG